MMYFFLFSFFENKNYIFLKFTVLKVFKISLAKMAAVVENKTIIKQVNQGCVVNDFIAGSREQVQQLG